MSRNMLFLLSFFVCFQLTGCGSDGSEESDNIIGEAADENCATNNTGELLYANSTNFDFFVSINGLNYGVVKPGEILRANLDAGFIATASSLWVDGIEACQSSSTPIVQCQSRGIECRATH